MAFGQLTNFLARGPGQSQPSQATKVGQGGRRFGAVQNYPAQQPQQQQPQQPAYPQAQTLGQVQASYQPSGIYPADYTRQAQNLASAAATPAMGDIRGPYRNGVSFSSPLAQYQMALRGAQGGAEASLAPGLIGMQHGFANAGNMLQGQMARDREGQGWAGLGLDNQANQAQFDLGRQNSLLNFLQGMYQWM